MRRHLKSFVISGIVVIGGLASMLMGIILALQSPPQFQNAFVRITVYVLIAFLGVLVFRYITLLWLGYLQFIEDVADEGKGDQLDDDFLPPISIIVPAYNEEPMIQSVIRSLLRLDYPRYEILIVDDGSTDATFQRAAELEGTVGGATVRVVSKSNGGKATALNTGLSLARHPFVLCMDADSKLEPQTLRRAIRHFRDPRVAAVAGNVKVANRRNLWTRFQALEYIEGLNMPRRAQGFIRAVNIIPGPCGLFRRDVLIKLGGYDTDTFAEDADLTLKLLREGWRIEYEDLAIAWTEAPETLRNLLKQRYRWTRGILQAVAKRADILWHPRRSPTIWASVTQLLFEGVVWPFMNVFGHLFFAMVALAFGAGPYLVSWWLLLTLLDLAAAFYTVVIEEEDLSLVPLAIAYRFVFILIIDVAKLFATLEQVFDVKMSWGKVERLGRI
ncbi:MAG TPA: glycosyltransferase [Longimicrobiales bacterium]|nr:glycosyltransferase [Longimicrobiales bacterium]